MVVLCHSMVSATFIGTKIKNTNKASHHGGFDIHIKAILFGFYLHAWRLVV